MDRKKRLTKGDLINMFIRMNLQQASFNFERIHALGFCFNIIPAIKRLYNSPEDQKAALKRHLTFFNVTPACVGPVLGVTAAMEEAKANGAKIEESAISSIKIGMMGPFCGVGDPIFWGTLRPITAALGASIALTGSVLGPIIFFVLFNLARLAALWLGLFYGYKKGLDLVLNELKGNKLQKITEGASILGFFVMGALVSKWTVINIPVVISQITTADGSVITTTLQNIFDQLMPGLLGLGLTLLVCKLLKKRISPIMLIFMLFAVGIIGSALGILA
ncbi:PTS system mannose/fructose/sorbose family transporter subunit IID [Pectinatus cerevisiiphilus]|uniref:PTS system IID component (Man family) n=1 Tax=Pectinatus cerevisiiphilus TaxID=86956 RepID=A0A4R3K232_9FIRM|nr:mannose/fructose/sorbose PTS transporter subunit IID [Pectinatus cerevisiiphilus]TCS76162.1 PTS system IID component (Man family) [Pectinatus cerevisiiphilus]